MGDEQVKATPPVTIKQILNDAFPHYLAMGMTYNQYWCEPPELAVAYRRADEIRRRNVNTEAWLQGAYFYNALIAASPVLNAMSKRNKPLDYMQEPIPLTEKDAQELKLRKEREARDRLFNMLKSRVAKNE